MYCPKCGTQNPENPKVCSSCGQSLPALSASQPAKTSALAIWSLVLGVLTLFGGLVTAIPAVICGIIGLVKIKNYKLKGKGLAIAGITVASCIFIMQISILLPALSKARQTAQRIMCATNLSGLGKAMMVYTEDNSEGYPPADNWCEVLVEDYNVSPAELFCPFSGAKKGESSYVFNRNAAGRKDFDIPPDMVLIFETNVRTKSNEPNKKFWNLAGGPELLSTENHQGEGCNILFADGHVRFEKVTSENIDTLRWAP